MFLMQSSCVLDVARTLGASRGRAFFQIALPLARPAIAVGVALALMEAMNDIGAVEYLGVRTLTVSIYTTWLNRGSLGGAAQIALFALAVITALVWLERQARRRQRYASQAQRQRRLTPMRLAGWRAGAAVAACASRRSSSASRSRRCCSSTGRCGGVLHEGVPDGFARRLLQHAVCSPRCPPSSPSPSGW